MGFYGNITNVNKSTFQFDKIYPNAAEMLKNAATDGIFIGRYVLVDYDSTDLTSSLISRLLENLQEKPSSLKEWGVSSFYPAYKLLNQIETEEGNTEYIDGSYDNKISIDLEDFGFYKGKPREINGSLSIEDIAKYSTNDFSNVLSNNNSIFLLILGYIKRSDLINEENPEIITSQIDFEQTQKPELWKLDLNEENKVIATRLDDFNSLEEYKRVLGEKINIYTLNYGEDLAYFSEETGRKTLGRGYDSTVWQKVLKNGVVTYVWIAELNSVVPAFDITVDAPTEKPRPPYWDKDTSNLYYKLHVQPSWGMRVKNESDSSLSDLNGKAIYWNQAGFDKYLPSVINKNNEITVMPTGSSGYEYWDVANPGHYRSANDIYELSIALPQIGNIISNIWDIIYGKAHKLDATGHILLNDENLPATDENKFRNIHLEWGSHLGERMLIQRDSEDNPSPGYNPEALNTLAGTINSVHDLMGMIIVTKDDISQIEVDDLDINNIYYDKKTDKYYFKEKAYVFNESDNNENIAITDMIERPSEGLFKLKSFDFENLKTGELNSGNNYYYVSNEEPLLEDGVYGLITVKDPDPALTVENYNPTSQNSDEWIWIWNESSHTFTRKIDALTEEDGGYYHILGIQTVKSVNIDKTLWPHFYVPGQYYLGIKNFSTIQDKQSWESTLDSQLELEATSFDTITLCKENSYFEAKKAAGVIIEGDNNQWSDKPLIGYRLLQGIKVDPKKSSYELIDENLQKETNIEVDNIYVKKDIDGYYIYEYAGIIEKLQNCEESLIPTGDQSVEQLYISYLGSKYRDTQKNDETPIKTDGGLRTLNEWKEYVEHTSGIEVSDLNLILEQKFVPELVKPSYSLSDAIIIKNLEDFENGYVDYYYSDTDSNYFTQLSYNAVKTFYEQGTGQAMASWYKINPKGAFIYYKIEGEYYIEDNNSNWIRVTNKNLAGYEDISILKNIIWEPKHIFIPNTYYYKDNEGNFILAPEYQEGTVYYRYPDAFVITDQNNVYAEGAKWNEEVPIPVDENENPYVTVGYKNYKWELRELPGFSDQINTMHGLILKVNKMLLEGDLITRDRSTVQGAINTLNDIIDKFDQLVPAEIVMVDAYGRIHSGNWDTEQAFGYENIGRPNQSFDVPENASSEDNEKWIKLTTTPGEATNFKPHIKIEHQYNPVNPTFTQSNKNLDELYQHDENSENVDEGLNINGGDTIDLYTPIIDNMGHVVGSNTETVTLPYGFKFINIGSEHEDTIHTIDGGEVLSGDTIDNLSIAGRLRADNTQDEFTINPSNKWIRIAGIDTQNNGELITIGHEIHNIDESSNGISDFNGEEYQELPSGTDSINIPDWKYDRAGHIIEKHNHYYMLPYSFKTIKVTNDPETVVTAATNINTDGQIADNTQDTLTFSASNKWIGLDNNTEDTVKIGHLVQNINEQPIQTVTDLNNSSTDSVIIPDWTFDEAGHIRSKQSHEYRLPYNFKTFAVGAANIGTDNLTHSPGSIVADTVYDTATFNTGNDWIKLAANAENDSITVGHKVIHTDNISKGDAGAQAPNFGATFKVPYITIDKAGHVTELTEHDVTLHGLSLSNDTTGNVVTGITLTDETGAFTETKENVGILQLGSEYRNVTSLSDMPNGTDTINNAIGKLAYILNNNTTQVNDRITNAIYSLDSSTTNLAADEVLTKIEIENGQISNQNSLSLNDFVNALKFGVEAQRTISEMARRIEELEKKLLTYSVSYQWDENDVPEGVSLPNDSTLYAYGSQIVPISLSNNTIEDDEKIWTFNGWTPANATVTFDDITFTGSWSYELKPEEPNPEENPENNG